MSEANEGEGPHRDSECHNHEPGGEAPHPDLLPPRGEKEVQGRSFEPIMLTILFDGAAYGMLLFVLACGCRSRSA